MACSYCGCEVPALARRCPECGRPVSTATAVLTPLPAPGPSAQRSADNATTSGLGSPDTTFGPDIGPTIGPDDYGATLGRAAELLTVGPGAAPPPDGPSGPLSVGQDFGGRYHILRLLGIGGMGAVYQAWDAELGVAVAIKVIRRDIMANPRAAADVERRFKRELLLARQVTHKNVVRIHDLGELDGVKYITMPYVEGTDLASLLKKEGRLKVETVLPVARSIVSGLMAAHGAGVVHRDLKPANIMIDAENQALIMDFGIANSTGVALAPSPAPASLPSRLRESAVILQDTMNGAIVGTLQYMAPEQARGDTVDERADIYAIGLILYDMLVGRDHSGNAMETLRARMEAAPPAPKSIVPELPDAVDALIMRCIQPDPAARFQTTAQLAAELDRLDEHGVPLPIKRTVGLPLMAGVVTLLLALSGAVWWYTRPPPPPVQHDPVSVIIADFQNRTGDVAFDHTLEPMLKLALEGAGFITAYDRTSIRRGLGVAPPEVLDETATQAMAVKQGVGVVVTGSVEPQGNAYAVSIKATQAVTGAEIVSSRDRASSKEQVLPVATRLSSAVRKALGDDTSDAAQRFAADTLSATSLPVVREYAAAMEAMSDSRFEQARESFTHAVSLDPAFGLAYAGKGMAAWNLGHAADAQADVKEAITHLDGMTERERYRTRGLFYLITSDYKSCVQEYGDLIARYAADVTARNNLALCSTHLRDMPRALEEMRRVVSILPNRALYRVNLALYAAYGGDFATAEQEARAALELGSALGSQPLAFAQIGQGQIAAAIESYRAFGATSAIGASFAASGLGDLAVYEGRFNEAAALLIAGAAADAGASEPARAAGKLAALGTVRLLQGQRAAALAAADKALAASQAQKIRFLAGRIYVGAGQPARAQPLAQALSAELQVEPQALGKLLEAEMALAGGDARAAIKLFTDANALLDTWIGHLGLGRAYLAAEAFPQADSELDRCIKRRGEALALFLDEEPTYGLMPAVYYYQGQVREGLKSARAAESYRTYLDIRGAAGEDPLLADVRRRMAR